MSHSAHIKSIILPNRHLEMFDSFYHRDTIMVNTTVMEEYNER